MFKKLVNSIKDAINPPRYLVNQPNTSQSDQTEQLSSSAPAAHTRTTNSPLTHKSIKTKVAGVTKGKRQEYLEDCYQGQEITVVNEPVKNYPHAMAVYVEDKKRMIGYLNDELAKEVFKKYKLSEEDEIYGEIIEVTGGTSDKPTMGCNIEFYVA